VHIQVDSPIMSESVAHLTFHFLLWLTDVEDSVYVTRSRGLIPEQISMPLTGYKLQSPHPLNVVYELATRLGLHVPLKVY